MDQLLKRVEVANNNLLNLLFGLELDFGTECARGSEKHGEDPYKLHINPDIYAIFA